MRQRCGEHEELLIEHFGFKGANIQTRFDEDVTLENVAADWKWLVEKASLVIGWSFIFRGMARHVADDSSDRDEEDGADEILCLYDMNFDDPDTFLIDDQIHKWTKKIPDGVKMTFILDCCHSGTGTRALMPEMGAGDRLIADQIPLVAKADSKKRQNASEVRALSRKRGGQESENVGSKNVVLARYLRPPRSVQQLVNQSKIRSSIRSVEQDTMNHVRFSGCMDNQTSADAYIADDFQGAFSANFIKAIKSANGDIDHDVLISKISDGLADDGFSQTPQMSPEGLGTNVFDGVDDSGKSTSGKSNSKSKGKRAGKVSRAEFNKLKSKLDS